MPKPSVSLFSKLIWDTMNQHFLFSAGGKPVDASQEMIALGICNVMGSFVSSMPTTGSFSRTAVNSVSVFEQLLVEFTQEDWLFWHLPY